MPRRPIACLLIFSLAFSQAAQAYTQDWLPQRGAALKLANISAGPSTGLRTGPSTGLRTGGLSVDAKGGVAIDIPAVPATPAPAPQRDAKGKLIPVVPLTPEQQAAQRQADLNQAIRNLASQPGQAWIGQLANDPKIKVQWNQVQTAAQHWNYNHDGLTPEAAAVVVIVVTYFTAGAASEAGAAIAGAGTAASAAITAGLVTLASQASVSLINNKGDLGKTLNDMGQSQNVKALVTAMVTAGLLQGLSQNIDIGGTRLSDINAQSSFSGQLQKNLINDTAGAVVNHAINGGDLQAQLEQSLRTAFIDTGSAQSANWIGDQYQNGALNGYTHQLAHAIAGCAAGAARAGDCGAGALGAVVGELSAELYGGARTNSANLDLPGLQTDTVNFARMMAGIAVAITGGDANAINLAASAGGNAAENNYLSHWQQAAYDKEMQACSSAACKIGASLRWGGTSVKQDAALVTGMALGAGIEVKDAVTALAELPQTIAMLANNPELLKGLPDGYVQGLQTTYNDYQTALESAGVDGATAAGVDFTHLVSQLALLPATVATGGAAAGYTVDKMAVLLDKIGTARAVDVAAVGGNLPLMSRPNFYVKSDGTTIPATGYRAVGGEQNIQEASQGVVSSRDPTYLTFDNITNMPGGQIKSLLQLEYPPTHVISFDTKQILNDIAIPNGRWGNFSIPEPLTNTFPEWGNGGGMTFPRKIVFQG